MSFNRDAWAIAKERYLSDLDPADRLIFQEATVENLYYDTSVTNATDRKSSKIRRAIEALQPLVDKIESYGKAMDAYANISPTILSPIWGSIRVVLIKTKGLGRVFEKITECLGRIGDILPRLLDYQRIFSYAKHPRLTESVARTYLDIIELCIDFRAMIKGQQKNPLKRVVHSSTVEQRLKDAETRFRAHRKAVEKEAETCHMIEAAEARAVVLRDRQLQEMNNKAETKIKLLRFMSVINSQQKHQKVRSIRHRGTGDWLFATHEYRSWTSMSTSTALCCHGIPGCGKTILTSSVIDTLMVSTKVRSLAVAYHYCDYADKRTLEPVVILGALARTLLERIDIPTEISELISESYRDGERVPESIEVLEILSRAIDLFKGVAVVVDGIDEVKEEDRQGVYDALKTLVRSHKVPIKLYMSCRENILAAVSTLPVTSFRVQISETTTSIDIQGYIHHQVASLIQNGDLVIRKPALEGAIVDALAEGAKGMFLWVKFQLDELCTAESDDAIINTLRNLPKDLIETYDRLLGRIMGVQRQELIKRMFRWIICARRPLLVDELCEGIAFTINDTRWNIDKIPTDILRLVTACGNLVVVDDETRTIQLAHYTVQQYILDDCKSREKFFHFDLQEAQEVLGDVCIAYLNFSDFETQVTAYIDNNVTAGMAVIERIVATTDLSLPKTSTVDAMSIFNRMVHSRQKATNIDYSRHIPKKAEPVDHLLEDYRLLGYIRENWLWHTATFSPNHEAKTRRDILFHNLPFSFRPWHANTNTKMKYVYLEPVGWALSINHCPLIQTLLKIDPTFNPSTYFEDAGRWLFEDKINTYISSDILERLELCVQDTWDAKSTPAQGWLYSRMLNACRRGNIDILRLCMPELLRTPGLESNESHYPWFQIRGHLMLEAAANNQLGIVNSLTYSDMTAKILGDYKSFAMMYDGQVYNALERAVLAGHLEIVRALHQAGWQPKNLLEFGAADGIIRLDQAAAQGNLQVVVSLLEVLQLDWLDLSYEKLEMCRLDALVSAASGGHENMVRACRKYGLDPLKSDGRGMCAFMRAIRNGRVQVVEYLLSPDAELRIEGCGVRTNVEGLPLSLAASMGYLKIAEMLLKHGADTITASSSAENLIFSSSHFIDICPTPLYAASANGQIAMVEFLLANGAGPDVLSPTGVLSQSTTRDENDGLTRRRIFYSDKRAHEIRDIISKIDVADWQRPLAGAAVNGHLNVVSALLRNNVDINAKDSNGDTALLLAAALGYSEIMEALLEAGAASVDLKTNIRAAEHFFLCAADAMRADGVKCLLKLGVSLDFSNADGQTVLFNAVTTGSPAAAKLLLEAGASLDTRDCRNDTPLVVACLHGNVEAASILIGAGADIRVKNSYGQSVLLQSCRKSTVGIVELLIASGAMANSDGSRINMPLLTACDRGHKRIVQLLLASGADVNFALSHTATNEVSENIDRGAWPEGTTPLMVAAKRWPDILSALIEKGAKIDATDIYHRNALMYAVLEGRVEAAKLLIESGASVVGHDINGDNILLMAVKTKSLEIVKSLLALHDLAMLGSPPRLLFTSRDSGKALDYAYSYFIDFSEFRQGLEEIGNHYNHTKSYQKRHQQRYKGEEKMVLQDKWMRGIPVPNEDQEPYDLVNTIPVDSSQIDEFKALSKSGNGSMVEGPAKETEGRLTIDQLLNSRMESLSPLS